MAWPTATIPTTNLDSDGDSPKLARPDLLAAVQALNVMIQSGGVPPGAVQAFAGSSAPAGWLLCAGQAVSRSTYADLFGAIGTTYGVGDGSTTFGLPDLRGRVPAGLDNMGGAAANRLTSGGSGVAGTTLGAAGGAETHTLTVPQMPAHTHGFTAVISAGQGGSGLGASTPASGTTGSTGGGGAHNNTQPTMVLNYIIKT